MSRIQELLAKQRGQQNVTVEKPVLQPTTSKETAKIEAVTEAIAKSIEQPKKPSLFEKLGKKSGGANGNGGGILGTNDSKISVVEQGAIKVIANGHDVTDKMPLTVKELTKQRAEENANSNQIGANNSSVVVDKSKGPELSGNTNNTGQEQSNETTIPKIAEIAPEIMPAGLSMLAQMKWKREHVHKTISTSEVSSTGKEGTSNQKLSSEIEKPTPLQSDGNIASPSQQVDAQKTNDGTANIEELKRNLAYLANNIENKEMVGQVVRTIASQLKNSPELCPGMTNADVNLVVRGARMAYQVAATRKQEKADVKKSKSKDTEALDAFFKDAGINFNM